MFNKLLGRQVAGLDRKFPYFYYDGNLLQLDAVSDTSCSCYLMQRDAASASQSSL